MGQFLTTIWMIIVVCTLFTSGIKTAILVAIVGLILMFILAFAIGMIRRTHTARH